MVEAYWRGKKKIKYSNTVFFFIKLQTAITEKHAIWYEEQCTQTGRQQTTEMITAKEQQFQTEKQK